MSDDGGDVGAFMAGFLIGGLVGAATAFILAPQSGAETRAQISSKSDEMRRAGEHQYHEYRAKAETAVSDASGKMQETSRYVQERARIVLDDGKTRSSEESATSEVLESDGQERTSKQDASDDEVGGDEQ
jgi:gas vesicle protein